MATQTQENEIIVKPIVYGSVAFYLGKKAEETNSHKWCVYVRGLNNEDISYFVKEVVFTLHSSFENHNRVVSEYPFELYESGWGQFDIIITVYLVDENAKPIEFVHPLKLYPTQTHASMSTKKPVVSESYEEIIFVNPKPYLREILLNPPIKPQSSIQIPIQAEDDMQESYISNEDRMVVEKSLPKELANEALFRREPSLKLSSTFNENFNNMYINTQMDVIPQSQPDLNMDANYGEFDQMRNNQEMQVDKALSISESNQAKDIDKSVNNDKRINSSYIPDIAQHFLPVDDTPHFKLLEDANKFVLQEINRLRKNLEDTDREIVGVKKSIKELVTKIN